MKIPKQIQARIAKRTAMKPNLSKPFYQDGYEYITNTFLMVKVPKANGVNAEDVPIMAMAEKDNAPKDAKYTRFDIGYLIDMLAILRSNGAEHVDIAINPSRAIVASGTKRLSNDVVTSGLLMAVVE